MLREHVFTITVPPKIFFFLLFQDKKTTKDNANFPSRQPGRGKSGKRKMTTENPPINFLAHGTAEDGAGIDQTSTSSPSSVLLRELTAPIPGRIPVGDDPKYSPEFESVKNEIEKSGGMDTEFVQAQCHTILTKQAKDIRVFGYYSMAALKEQDINKVCEIVQALCLVYVDLMGEMHPMRETAKMKALAWFNQDRLNSLMEKVNAHPDQHSAIAQTCETLNNLKESINSKFPNNPPSIGRFIKSFQKWRSSAFLQKPASKPTSTPLPTQNSDAASPEAAPQNFLSVQSGPIFDKSSAQNLLQQVAEYYQSLDESISTGYKIMRILKWSEIKNAPVVTDGVIKIQGPHQQLRDFLETLFESENWNELLLKSEEAFTRPGLHFWLDLQFYSWQALAELDHTDCAEALNLELNSLLKRAPELVNMSYSDGIPFASEKVKDWIQECQSKQNSTAPTGVIVNGTPQDDEEKNQINLLIKKRKLGEALALVECGVKGLGLKERAGRKYYMAELCYRSEKYLAAERLLESLIDEFEGEMIQKWDIDFTGNLYSLAMKTVDKLSEQAETSAEEKNLCRQLSRRYLKTLMAIDPVKFASLK